MYQSLSWLENICQNLEIGPMKSLTMEIQNEEYEGFSFQLNNRSFRSRLAKLTPTKKGYFVVFWEKDAAGKNQPYTYADSPEKIIVSVLDGTKKGQFVFPKDILLQKGILSGENSKGKMGIRVYPAWETDLNQTAQRTQKWQQDYFVDLTHTSQFEVMREYYLE